MRFVPIKNSEQQAVLSLHRARQGFVKARTAQANQIRGLLMEYGITIPCNECDEEIFLLPDSDWHKLIIEFCKCRNWVHTKCPEK